MNSSHEFKDRLISSASSFSLIEYGIEFILLEMLSVELRSFFNNPRFKKDDFKTLKTRDIHFKVLENHFLRYFTPNHNKEKEVLPLYEWKNGDYYTYIEFKLPKGSEIKRGDQNEIIIDNKYIEFSFKPVFKGVRTDYSQNYRSILGENFKFQLAFIFELYFNIEFKIPTFFSTSFVKEHKWIDNFITKIHSEISEDAFFNKINLDSFVFKKD